MVEAFFGIVSLMAIAMAVGIGALLHHIELLDHRITELEKRPWEK